MYHGHNFFADGRCQSLKVYFLNWCYGLNSWALPVQFIALKYMSLTPIDNKSILVQVMACCHQAISNITVTSYQAQWHLKSPLSRLFIQPFVQAHIKTPKLYVTGLCAGIHQGPVNSLHKGPVTWKMFPFDDAIMITWTDADLVCVTIWHHKVTVCSTAVY